MATPSTSASDLRDELMNCNICLHKLTQPKTLRCLHTFCQRCLEGCLNAYLQRNNHQQNAGRRIKVSCPTCREETPLPEQGIAGLKTDFKVSKIADLINAIDSPTGKTNEKLCSFCRTAERYTAARYKCQECAKYFCKKCLVVHQQTFAFISAPHLLIDLKKAQTPVPKTGPKIAKKKNGCKVHPGELLRYYCRHCHKKLCCLCAMLKNTKHKLMSLADLERAHELKKAQRVRMLKEKKQYAKIMKRALLKKKLDDLEVSLRESYDDTSEMKRSGSYCKRLQKIRKQLRKSYLLIRHVQAS